MKKLLIATAALAMVAGTAQAQSSVSVYGIMDISYSDASQETTLNGANVLKGSKTSTGNGDGGLSTSRLGFKGTEDLGGGNKANFVLEYDLVDVGTGGQNHGARYSWVGLESASMGQLRLGRQESSAHSVVVGGSAGGANNVAGAMYSGDQTPDMGNGISVRPHAVFVDKTITYIAPKMGGFTAEVQMGKVKDTNQVAAAAETEDKRSHFGGSLKYSVGKLSIGYAYQQIKVTDSTVGASVMSVDTAGTNNENAKTTTHVLAASYDFGVAKLFGLHGKTKFDENLITTGARNDNAKAKTTEIGVQVPVGKALLWASMFDGSDKTNTNPAAPLDFDTSGFQLGARYDLSKRTSLYAIYGTQEVKGSNLATTGMKAEATGTSVGVRHSF